MNTRTLSKLLIALFLVLATASLFARADTYVYDYNTKYFLTTFKKFIVKYVWKDDNPCKWAGVICNGNQTSAQFGLPGQEVTLKGDMPGQGSDAQYDPSQVLITAIYLSGNAQLTGTFPSFWYQFKQLQYIGLASTGLQGTIPESWQLMPAIMSIDLSYTKACMNLPTWRRTVSDMGFFNIFNLTGDSWMRGTIPDTWSTFRGARLDFRGTEFCGCAPDSVANIDLIKNQLIETNPKLFADDCATANVCGAGATKCGATNTISDAATAPSVTLLAATVASIVACVAAFAL